MTQALFVVFLGGGIGSVLRFLIGITLKPFSVFPFHTLLANLLASLVFAFVYYHARFLSALPFRTEFLLAGFCGGLSTFSAFSYETFILFQEKKIFLAGLNIFLNVLMCIGVFYFFLNKKPA